MEQTKYFYSSIRGGLEFSKEFYDLGLHEKYEIVKPLLEAGIDRITEDRLVRAILQHSTPSLKKMFPVLRERKQSKAARLADEAYQKTHKEETLEKTN